VISFLTYIRPTDARGPVKLPHAGSRLSSVYIREALSSGTGDAKYPKQSVEVVDEVPSRLDQPAPTKINRHNVCRGM